MTEQNRKPILIAIDHGYGNVKTPHFIFPTGVTAYSEEPAMSSETLNWAGRWYAIGDSHKEFIADKTTDEDYVNGQPMYSKSGKIVLWKSYSILQDQYHDHMVAAGYTDLERGERGSTEEHLTTVQFKVMKEEAHLERLLQQQQTAKQAVSDVQKEREEKERAAKEAEMKLRITEKEREEMEQAAKEAEMKLRITEKEAQKTLDFVQKLGSAETILEKPGRLESARSVYTRAVTVIGKLIGKLRSLLVLYHGERAKNEALNRENRIWQERAKQATEITEKASKFDQLAKILGLDEIERILKEHIPRKQEKHNMREGVR